MIWLEVCVGDVFLVVMNVADKISGLRKEMLVEGIDALIVGNTDPHNNEYVAERFRSREWLAEMKGSSGTVILTKDWCGLWADSRYYEAAMDALAGTEIELVRMSDEGVLPIDGWLKANFADAAVVAFDGAVTDVTQGKAWKSGLELVGLKVQTDLDLVERVWVDRPEAPCGEFFVVDDEYAGESVESKISRVRGELKKLKVDAHLLGRTDESCWLFNVRGTDIENTPTPYCFTMVTQDEVLFFVDAVKVSDALRGKLEGAGVTLMPYDGVEHALKGLAAEKRVLIVPRYTNFALAKACGHCVQMSERAVVTDLKGVKNATEVKHLKQALIDDGAAMVRFYTWMYKTLREGSEVTELSASRKLTACRAEFAGFRHYSFESIMGYGADGALNHYSVDEESDKPVKLESIFLIDSGGNFTHGTTDTTRVIPMGEPNQEQKDDYTLVLRSLIELITLEFAEGATGAQLDGICRQSLWRNGRNFKHGTGHGVGFGLEVHEGPQGISGMSTEKFVLGQITTIEPGCYRPGSHGIRIENMVHTVLAQETDFGKFFKFENLTFCPINVDLVERSLLTDEQVTWLNDYNAEVLEKLSPMLGEGEVAWLTEECRGI